MTVIEVKRYNKLIELHKYSDIGINSLKEFLEEVIHNVIKEQEPGPGYKDIAKPHGIQIENVIIHCYNE